jgi:AcrR family transcriptional regulator
VSAVTAESGPRDAAGLPRDERRRRTESAILEAARQQFAEDGYERVTIRGVAGQAGIDPALVMQYYGSKEQLFAAAARWPAEHQQIKQATPDTLPAAALADVFARFESDERESVMP